MNFSSAFLKLHRHRIQTFILNLGKCSRVVTLFGLLARTQACNAQHGALAWRQTQSCWWNGTKYSYCMLIHATRTLSVNILSFVLHYIVIAKTCQSHHSLNQNNLYLSFTRLIDQILYPFLDSHHISSIHHPSCLLWFSGFAKAEQLRHPKRQQRGGSERQRIVRPWCFQFQNETPWLRNASRKNVCCSSLERAVVRRNVIRQRPKNPCTTRQWGPWNYLQVMTSRSTIAIYFWQFQWQPDPTQGAQSCKIPIKLQFSLLAPALLILGLPLLFSSFLAAWRLDVRLPDKWGKPNFSQGPWSRGVFQPQTVALWIRKCKGALVFVGNHPHIIRPGRCRF